MWMDWASAMEEDLNNEEGFGLRAQGEIRRAIIVMQCSSKFLDLGVCLEASRARRRGIH